MALKDWKKQKNNFGWIVRYKNSKTKQIIAIDDDFLFIKGGGKIGRYVFVKSTPYGDKSLKRFKTKQEALAYAKAYMRTH